MMTIIVYSHKNKRCDGKCIIDQFKANFIKLTCTDPDIISKGGGGPRNNCICRRGL